MDNWISVDDELPEDGKEVLVYRNNYGCRIEIYYEGFWGVDNLMEKFYPVTHWQPLPDAPKGVSDGG